MSNQNPSQRRRRIAGERKGARPADAPHGADLSRVPAADPVRDDRRAAGATTPPPPPAARATGTSLAPATGTTPGRVRNPVPVPVMIGLGLLTLLLVVLATVGLGEGTGVRGFQEVDEQTQVDQAARTAPSVAERAAAAILSYDYETLEADRNTASRYMTKEYRTEYFKTFGLVLDNAPDLKAVVEAEVKASGVAHADPDRVNVLLFVNQTTTSTANGGEPQIALNRAMFDMEKQGGTWLVDGITSY